jgi:hypothetical protein
MMTKVITEAFGPMRRDRRSDTNLSWAIAGVVRFTAFYAAATEEKAYSPFRNLMGLCFFSTMRIAGTRVIAARKQATTP